METENDGNLEEESQERVLCPPRSSGEKFRDRILRTLDHPFFQILGIIAIILIVVSGAMFFFLLMGWQSMCRPRTDCEPRNWWYNFSIQMLNVLFTYTGIISMPWRSTNFLHIAGWGCPRRRNDPGYDLYGLPIESDPWFYVPLRKRMGITIILLLNALTQFANQATRIRYYTYELSNEFPGNVWTNVFFAASFLFAFIGGIWLGYEVYLLRKEYPTGKFGPDPLEQARSLYEKQFGSFSSKNIRNTTVDGASPENEVDSEAADASQPPGTEQTGAGLVEIPADPTREVGRRSVVHGKRSSMRMFAM